MKIRLSFLGKAVTAAFLVLAPCLLFTGCDSTTNGDPPQRFGPKVGAELSGTWSSTGEYGTDIFKIDTTTNPKTFTYWFTLTGTGNPDYSSSGSMDYKGNIVGEIENDPALLQRKWGYITIQVTNSGEYGPTINKYLVIRWENLTAFSVDEAGAHKNGSTNNGGRDTQQDAENEYTVENGYFGMFGTYLSVP